MSADLRSLIAADRPDASDAAGDDLIVYLVNHAEAIADLIDAVGDFGFLGDANGHWSVVSGSPDRLMEALDKVNKP